MQVNVSDDGTEAYAVAVSPDFGDGRPVTVAHLKSTLDKQGIRVGIRDEALQTLADTLGSGEGYSGKPILLARGKPPGPGHDGKLVLSPPEEADLEKGNLVWLVLPGQKIATVIPPAPGEPGMSVRGEEIPGQLGKAIKIRLGKGVQTGQNGRDVVATVAGFVHFDWKSISVSSPVSVSRDKMTAYLNIIAPTRIVGAIRAEDYCKLLRTSGVVHGISEKAVQEALQQSSEAGQDRIGVVVAKGTNPIRGEDARIEYKFSNEVRPGLLLPDGRMDYRERDLIQNVTVDQELAVKIPATPGTTGTTVTGETIPAKPGIDTPLKALDNVELSPDGATLSAKREGMAVVDRKGGVRVVTEFVVRGDVDYATGNVRCRGSIKIEGSVLPDFSVESEQDVMIDGGVDSSNVYAEGNVFVGHGIHGSADTRVVAGGGVRALFIESATIRAKDDIVLGQSLRHSDVRTTGAIKVTERKGAIAGGKIFATCGILANELGSELGTRTELVVGVDTSKLELLESLEEKVDGYENELRRLDAQLGPAVEQSKRTELHAGKKSWIAKLLKQRAGIVEERDKAAEARNKLTGEMRADLSAKVRVMRKVYPGVVVRIGEATYSVGDPKQDVTFSYDEDRGEIVCIEGR